MSCQDFFLPLNKYAVIGARSVFTTDIPDFAIAAGVPAKNIKMRK